MLILNGNGADIAKHCTPIVQKKHIFFFGINILYVDSLHNEFSYNLDNILFLLLLANNKISVITNILVLKFYEYIINIDGYFDKNIGKTKINKNTLKLMEIIY